MLVSKMKQSKYITKDDVGVEGKTLTMQNVTQENMAKEGEPEELRYVLHFMEAKKGMVLNITNANLIAHITGQQDTDNWGGHQITIYNDPTISMGGKIVGGIRVRVPNAPAPAPAAQPPGGIPQDFDDDIPF